MTRHAEGTLAQRWDYVDVEVPDDWGYSRAIVPSIHMPRWASRITLEVTGVRTHRLQMIRNSEIAAEGFTSSADMAWLWDELHGEGAWRSDPEVVALTFKVHKANVDKLEIANA